MILQGDGHTNILHGDSLAKLSKSFEFRPILDRGGFDIVLLDPPLGAQSHSTEGFVLGTGRSRQDTAILLLERAIQFTKPGGRIAALVGDNLLFSENMNVAREFLRRNAVVKAIVSLPPGILRPFTSAKVSAIILEKKKESFDSPYNIFMAHVNAERELAAVVDQYHNTRLLTGPDTFTLASAQLDNRWNVEFHQLAPPLIGQPLSTFASIRRGRSIPSTEYITEGSDGLPYIRISDLVKGTVTRHSVRYVPTRAASALARTKTNDVLFSLTGTIGKTALVPKELDGAAVSSQLAIIRPNEKAAVAGFLAKVLASKKMREQIKRFTTGAIIEHISVEDLRKLLVSLPPIEEQKSTLASIQELESSSQDLSDSQRQLQERIAKLLEGE